MNLDFLLITATEMEQEPVRARMEISGKDHPLARPWHRGSLFGKSVLLIEGGVGQVNTASALTLALTRHEPAAILQFGAGGAYVRSGLGVGDLAIATEECYGDTGVLTPEGWIGLEEMGFPMLPGRTGGSGKTPGKPLYNRIPLDAGRARQIRQCLESGLEGHSGLEGDSGLERESGLEEESGPKIAAGPFVTVQQCSGAQAAGDRLAARYDGICENMEGAAAAHVSAAAGIPFVEIRGISNRVVDRDLTQWDLPLAIRRCRRAVELIVRLGVR